MLSEDKVLLTIAICTLDKPSTLHLLDRLRSQSANLRGIEIVVMNNGPVQTLKAPISGLEDVVYYHDEIPGLSRARNAAVRVAKGEYVHFLDDDVVLPDGFVDAVLRVITEFHPDVLGGPIDPIFEGPIPAWLPIDYVKREKSDVSGWSPSGTVSGGNFAVRRQVCEAIGGFREELGMVGERLGFLEEFEFLLRYRRWKGRQSAGIYYSHACRVGHATPGAKFALPYLCARTWKSHAERGRLFASCANIRAAFCFSAMSVAILQTGQDFVLALRRALGAPRRAGVQFLLATVGRFGIVWGSLRSGKSLRIEADLLTVRRLLIGMNTKDPVHQSQQSMIRLPNLSVKALRTAGETLDFWAFGSVVFKKTPGLRSLIFLAYEYPAMKVHSQRLGVGDRVAATLRLVYPEPMD